MDWDTPFLNIWRVWQITRQSPRVIWSTPCFNVTQSKKFPPFFQFVHASWQSHNGLINNRPGWRQWASLGLMQALWFGFGLCGLWRVKENHLFWCAFFSHVSDMHALSGVLRARCFSLSVCSNCCQTDGDWSEGSLLHFHKANLTSFCQPFYQLSLFLLVFNRVLSLTSAVALKFGSLIIVTQLLLYKLT